MTTSSAPDRPEPGEIRFDAGHGGLQRLAVRTDQAEADIYLQGAHLTHYQPAHAQHPLLFVSPCSRYEAGVPIRGGVPICMPWFGPKQDDPQAPLHGFFRVQPWQVQTLGTRGDAGGEPPEGTAKGARGGDQIVELSLTDSLATRAWWPYAFAATMRFVIGEQLHMGLTLTNRSDQPCQITQALHTYLRVSDVRQISITGLEGAHYFDKVASAPAKQASSPMTFQAKTDRVFLDTASACVLTDPGLDRRIVIEKTGSQSTVVWNPWIDDAKAMPDLCDDDWMHMVCIETANALDNAVTLQPGQSHEITATIRIEPGA